MEIISSKHSSCCFRAAGLKTSRLQALHKQQSLQGTRGLKNFTKSCHHDNQNRKWGWDVALYCRSTKWLSNHERWWKHANHTTLFLWIPSIITKTISHPFTGFLCNAEEKKEWVIKIRQHKARRTTVPSRQQSWLSSFWSCDPLE